jgi:hypothetical protein
MATASTPSARYPKRGNVSDQVPVFVLHGAHQQGRLTGVSPRIEHRFFRCRMGQQLRIQIVEDVALRIGVRTAGLDLDTEGEHTLAQRGLQLGVMGGDGALSVDIRDRWHRGAPLRLCPCKPRAFPSASVPLHLALAGGATTAIAGVMPYFTSAFAAAPPTDRWLRMAAVGAVALGALGARSA